MAEAISPDQPALNEPEKTEEQRALEILSAAEALKAAGQTASITIHGWQLELKVRPNNNKVSDLRFLHESTNGKRCDSILALKRCLGLVPPDPPPEPPPPPQDPLPVEEDVRPRRSSHRTSLNETQMMNSHATEPGMGLQAVGRRLAVLWRGCVPPTWFHGVVRDFSVGEHLVAYDDGETKWHNLTKEIALEQLQWEAPWDPPTRGDSSSTPAPSASAAKPTKAKAKLPAAAAAEAAAKVTAAADSSTAAAAGSSADAAGSFSAGAAGSFAGAEVSSFSTARGFASSELPPGYERVAHQGSKRLWFSFFGPDGTRVDTVRAAWEAYRAAQQTQGAKPTELPPGSSAPTAGSAVPTTGASASSAGAAAATAGSSICMDVAPETTRAVGSVLADDDDVMNYGVGDSLLARDRVGMWGNGRVVAVRFVCGGGESGRPRRELKVHFHGWNTRHDEWIGEGTGRLQPFAPQTEGAVLQETAGPAMQEPAWAAHQEPSGVAQQGPAQPPLDDDEDEELVEVEPEDDFDDDVEDGDVTYLAPNLVAPLLPFEAASARPVYATEVIGSSSAYATVAQRGTQPASSSDAFSSEAPPPPPPPDGWACPSIGDGIEVEVQLDEASPATCWVVAHVYSANPDGSFWATITLPDDSDQWEDMFTWETEGNDWRRPEMSGVDDARRVGGFVPAPPPGGFVCQRCGQGGFASVQQLGGHGKGCKGNLPDRKEAPVKRKRGRPRKHPPATHTCHTYPSESPSSRLTHLPFRVTVLNLISLPSTELPTAAADLVEPELEDDEQPEPDDCGTCDACVDQVRFGGPGALHRMCNMRTKVKAQIARQLSLQRDQPGRSGRQSLPPARLDPSFFKSPEEQQAYALKRAVAALELEQRLSEIDRICEERLGQRQGFRLRGAVMRHADSLSVSEFRIRWKGHGPEADSWLVQKQIPNGAKLVEKFRTERDAVAKVIRASDHAIASQMVRVKPPLLPLLNVLSNDSQAMQIAELPAPFPTPTSTPLPVPFVPPELQPPAAGTPPNQAFLATLNFLNRSQALLTSTPSIGFEGADATVHAELVNAVRKLRASSDLNQGDIAMHLGVSDSYLSKWFNGKLASGTSFDLQVANYLAATKVANCQAAAGVPPAISIFENRHQAASSEAPSLPPAQPSVPSSGGVTELEAVPCQPEAEVPTPPAQDGIEHESMNSPENLLIPQLNGSDEANVSSHQEEDAGVRSLPVQDGSEHEAHSSGEACATPIADLSRTDTSETTLLGTEGGGMAAGPIAPPPTWKSVVTLSPANAVAVQAAPRVVQAVPAHVQNINPYWNEKVMVDGVELMLERHESNMTGYKGVFPMGGSQALARAVEKGGLRFQARGTEGKPAFWDERVMFFKRETRCLGTTYSTAQEAAIAVAKHAISLDEWLIWQWSCNEVKERARQVEIQRRVQEEARLHEEQQVAKRLKREEREATAMAKLEAQAKAKAERAAAREVERKARLAARRLKLGLDEDDEDDEWVEREVGRSELAEHFSNWRNLVGTDVCVMADRNGRMAGNGLVVLLTQERKVGWRGEVTDKRGSSRAAEIEVFGQWYALDNDTQVRPIHPLQGEVLLLEMRESVGEEGEVDVDDEKEEAGESGEGDESTASGEGDRVDEMDVVEAEQSPTAACATPVVHSPGCGEQPLAEGTSTADKFPAAEAEASGGEAVDIIASPPSFEMIEDFKLDLKEGYTAHTNLTRIYHGFRLQLKVGRDYPPGSTPTVKLPSETVRGMGQEALALFDAYSKDPSKVLYPLAAEFAAALTNHKEALKTYQRAVSLPKSCDQPEMLKRLHQNLEEAYFIARGKHEGAVNEYAEANGRYYRLGLGHQLRFKVFVDHAARVDARIKAINATNAAALRAWRDARQPPCPLCLKMRAAAIAAAAAATSAAAAMGAAVDVEAADSQTVAAGAEAEAAEGGSLLGPSVGLHSSRPASASAGMMSTTAASLFGGGAAQGGLPDGWSSVRHEAPAGAYIVYHGPTGQKVRSKAQAWRLHEEAEAQAAQSMPLPDSPSLAASYVQGQTVVAAELEASKAGALLVTCGSGTCARNPSCNKGAGHAGWCRTRPPVPESHDDKALQRGLASLKGEFNVGGAHTKIVGAELRPMVKFECGSCRHKWQQPQPEQPVVPPLQQYPTRPTPPPTMPPRPKEPPGAPAVPPPPPVPVPSWLPDRVIVHARTGVQFAAVEMPFQRVHLRLVDRSDSPRGLLRRALPPTAGMMSSAQPPSKKQKITAPKNRQEERQMLAQAMSLSVSAAEARVEMSAVESRGGGHRVGGHVRMLPLLSDGSLPATKIDSKLWCGAAEQGWSVRPKSIKKYLERGVGGTGFSYWYISPSGERFSGRKGVMLSPEGQLCMQEAGQTGQGANDDDHGAVAVVAAESDDDDEAEHDAPAALVIGPSSGRSVADIVAAARADHAASAAKVLAANAAEDSGAEDGGDEDGERCLVCLVGKQYLLRCFGVKTDVGSAVGCAESAHVVCATCLERWWAAQKGGHKVCPCCRTQVRQNGAMRADFGNYYRGLLKVEGTW